MRKATKIRARRSSISTVDKKLNIVITHSFSVFVYVAYMLRRKKNLVKHLYSAYDVHNELDPLKLYRH